MGFQLQCGTQIKEPSQRAEQGLRLSNGDMIRARVTKGKKMGTYVGRVAIKTDGYFKIIGRYGMVEGIHARYCTPMHRDDGYAYTQGKAALPPQV